MTGEAQTGAGAVDRAGQESAVGARGSARRRMLGRVAEWVFYVTLIVFLILYVRSLDLDKLATLRPAWEYLAVATVAALAFRYWGAFIWTVILRSLGARDVRLNAPLTYVYAKSWLGRYIPGTAPWILSKIWFAAKHGISRQKLATSSLLEAALQVIVQFAFALVLLVVTGGVGAIESKWRWVLLSVLVAFAIVLVPSVFNWVIGLMLRILRRKPLGLDSRLRWGTVGSGVGLYAAGSIVGGASLFFIAKTVHPTLAYSEMPYVIGVSTLAGAVSMLAIFAPGGIGVREGIQIALLSQILSPEVALVIAVATRVHSVLVDLLFFALAVLGRRLSRSPSGLATG